MLILMLMVQFFTSLSRKVCIQRPNTKLGKVKKKLKFVKEEETLANFDSLRFIVSYKC
jgi:hypothetical protein